MLVDVPVVASDGINRELHLGEPRLRAAWLGPLHLRHPMVFGTLINIFAFLPLLLLTGDKGEFMKSLPIVVTPGPGGRVAGLGHLHAADQLLRPARSERIR